MNQQQRLDYLLNYLIQEQPLFSRPAPPERQPEKELLLRSLLNIRSPQPAPAEFLAIQDQYLQTELQRKGIQDVESIAASAKDPRLAVWRGDITTLKADGIVNAANSQMLGCFVPCHGCIDNAIHTYAGLQLRLSCQELMDQQGEVEPTGEAKITPAFNLPCRYVLHTVGPIVTGPLAQTHRQQLAACYSSCLALASAHGLTSLAFCCISTGEFHFPPEEAAPIAVETVQNFLNQNETSLEKVVFNVFKASDQQLYLDLLG